MSDRATDLHHAEREAANALLAALPPGDELRHLLSAHKDAISESWTANMNRITEAVAAHCPASLP